MTARAFKETQRNRLPEKRVPARETKRSRRVHAVSRVSLPFPRPLVGCAALIGARVSLTSRFLLDRTTTNVDFVDAQRRGGFSYGVSASRGTTARQVWEEDLLEGSCKERDDGPQGPVSSSRTQTSNFPPNLVPGRGTIRTSGVKRFTASTRGLRL